MDGAVPRRAATVTRRADKRLMLILFSCLTSEGRYGVRGWGAGAGAGLLAVAVWLICASHKKFNFISPFLISYSARRIWRKQSTLDNNYDAPYPGFQILDPYVSQSHENNAKKSAWLALYLYISYTFLFFLSSSFLTFCFLFAACCMREQREKQTANNSKWIQLKQSQS